MAAQAARLSGRLQRHDKHIVVVDEFEKLEDRLTGMLIIMREIARMAAKRG